MLNPTLRLRSMIQLKSIKKQLKHTIKQWRLAQDMKYDASIELLKQSVQQDPTYIEAYLSLGGVYGQVKNYNQSIHYYEQGFALDSNYTSDFRLPYTINLAGNGDFEKALTIINTLLSRNDLATSTRKAAEYRKRSYQFAVDYAKAHAQDNYVFTPINLGDGINSEESEYFPSLPVDGNEMIFTRRLNNFNEDFFISEKKDGVWLKATKLLGQYQYTTK